MNSKEIFTAIVKSAKKLILSDEFAGEYRIGQAFSRKGKLTFSNMMYFILHSTHKSISINYSGLRKTLQNFNLPHVSKQALSKARQGISHKAFLHLFRLSVRMYYAKYQGLKLWNGYHVYAVDGSTIQIPESKENATVFGVNPNGKIDETPLASVSALYDVMNDILVDASLKKYRHNERTSAQSHMEYLPGFQKSIILFDRGYPSEDMFRFLDRKGLFFLMRIPKTYKKLIFKQQDGYFTYPGDFTLRCINFKLPDGTTEYLVTNLMPSQLELHEFMALYKLRWGIESKYRELKNRLVIEAFNCIKPECIKQEFYVDMFISNLTAIIKQNADNIIRSKSNAGNKHSYQANRSFILNKIKSSIVVLLTEKTAMHSIIFQSVLEEAITVLSIIRPDRSFGRYRKNTRRKYYNHMKSCL